MGERLMDVVRLQPGEPCPPAEVGDVLVIRKV